MLSHCGFEEEMKITYNNITSELYCAMRVHLMNESELAVFCAKDARVWEDNCLDVQFMNYTAISLRNELDVIQALRGSIQSLLAAYPTTIQEDQQLIQLYEQELEAATTMSQLDVDVDEVEVDKMNEDDTPPRQSDTSTSTSTSGLGPVTYHAVRLRVREKLILQNALQMLDDHEGHVRAGNVTFQLELKQQERAEADLRAEAHRKFNEEVRRLASQREELAQVEVDLGELKLNLTLREGDDLKLTVERFAQKHHIQRTYWNTLETALRKRVVHPAAAELLLGVVTPDGVRRVLGIPRGMNATLVTGVFCHKYQLSQSIISGSGDSTSSEVTSSYWCQELLRRVEERLRPARYPFDRRVLLTVPVDAPDSRQLQLVVRQGEQHDLLQYVSDFCEFYKMSGVNLLGLAEEVHRRLPAVALQIPVGLPGQRQVSIRFALQENITEVVNGFANFYDIDENLRLAIVKRARQGMAPGTFMV